MSKIKITQVKSSIRRLPKQKSTLKALGLRGIGKSVEQAKTPAIEGMVNVVSHLVTVEEL